MLTRSEPIPTGGDWSFEVKWAGSARWSPPRVRRSRPHRRVEPHDELATGNDGSVHRASDSGADPVRRGLRDSPAEGTLKANREHPDISRIVGEYRVRMEALLSRVRELEADVAS
jgi:hypothetical protein